MKIKSSLLPVLAAVLLTQGCSFSYSSKSSSKSSASSSKSSASILSSPSSSMTEEELYQEEVIDFTANYLSTTEYDHHSFSRGISDIATANGVTSWEQDEATLIAIGRGLKEADLPEETYLGYKSGIAGNNQLIMNLIQKGYDEQ
ncbi:MAG: putative lipoprotein [Methyloprofundus sp.]|nr:putative lipoprotein [Methyloprofundus sp.]